MTMFNSDEMYRMKNELSLFVDMIGAVSSCPENGQPAGKYVKEALRAYDDLLILGYDFSCPDFDSPDEIEDGVEMLRSYKKGDETRDQDAWNRVAVTLYHAGVLASKHLESFDDRLGG
jgi:hypothetical protein